MKTTILCLAVTLAACSSLDPNVGPLHVEPTNTDDGGGSDAEEDVDDSDGFFAREIRPLFDRPSSRTEPKGCKGCHYSTELRHTGIDLGGFDMTTLGALRRGGGSSDKSIIVAGRPEQSVLVQALRGTYGYAPRMPKNGPFWTDEETQLVVDWIANGAKGRNTE